jgi:hypothetical protein
MKNNVLFLILIVLMVSGCAALRTPHREFRGASHGSHLRFLCGTQNRFAIYLPGIPSYDRSARLECDCASGTIGFDDKLRWPNSLYEIWWDTIPVQTPCLCKLYYLRYRPDLDKDIQKQVEFTRGFIVRNPDEDYVEFE